MGRFISADTIVPDFSNPQSLNRYAYVYNNPLKFTDPTGHDPWWLQSPWRQTTDQYDFNLPSYASSYAEQARVASYYGWAPPLEIIPNAQPIARSPEDQRQAIEMGIGMACEPCDWALTLNRWRQGDFSGWDVVGMASPVLPASAARKLGEIVGKGKTRPRDFTTPRTQYNSAWFNSEGEARALAREHIGHNPVEVEPNKWRSIDGKWQYRAKLGDLEGDSRGPHIHLEELNPDTGEVLQNWHLRWPSGTAR